MADKSERAPGAAVADSGPSIPDELRGLCVSTLVAAIVKDVREELAREEAGAGGAEAA
jgi:hypothetical protein